MALVCSGRGIDVQTLATRYDCEEQLPRRCCDRQIITWLRT